MAYDCSSEQRLLRDALSAFLADTYDLEARRRIVDSAGGWSPECHVREDVAAGEDAKREARGRDALRGLRPRAEVECRRTGAARLVRMQAAFLKDEWPQRLQEMKAVLEALGLSALLEAPGEMD